MESGRRIYKCYKGKEQITRSNFVDSLKYMEFTDAVQESCQTGSRIYLPLV